MKYTLNIGLNNTSYSKVVEELNNARNYYFDNYHIVEKLGSYNNIPEPTAVITFDSFANITSIVPLIKKFCINLDQICIAIKLDDNKNTFGILIYNPNFKGNKSTFDSDYFLE